MGVCMYLRECTCRHLSICSCVCEHLCLCACVMCMHECVSVYVCVHAHTCVSVFSKLIAADSPPITTTSIALIGYLGFQYQT